MPPSDDAEEDGDGKGAQIAREAGKARDETEMTCDPTGGVGFGGPVTVRTSDALASKSKRIEKNSGAQGGTAKTGFF